MNEYKRVVIKLGTNLLTGGALKLDNRAIFNLVNQIANLHNKGIEVVLVTSGAIVAGKEKANFTDSNTLMKQVFSSIGQSRLMGVYEKLFDNHQITVSQILLTKSDISNKKRKENIKSVIETLLSLKVIPIINENDVVSTEEITLGDNDNLSSIVSVLVKADLLLIASDVKGLYTKNPKFHTDAKLIKTVVCVNKEIKKLADGKGNLGTGGMITKIKAAEFATKNGIKVIITDNKEMDFLNRIILDGEEIGTMFLPQIGS